MVLNIVNNPFHYEMEKLCMVFFPEKNIRVVKEEPYCFCDDETVTVSVQEEDNAVIHTVLYTNRLNSLTVKNSQNSECPSELCAAQLLYKTLKEVTGKVPGWGVLTGIRTSKLMNRLIREQGKAEAEKYFIDSFYVSPQKTNLTMHVAETEQKIMNRSKEDSFSLYVSIPFCPTRCAYCSFVSSAVNKASTKNIIPEYFEKLLGEIRFTAEKADGAGIKMLSAYIGGGTPSILTASQIDLLLKTINSSFDMSNCEEFTFEAGRPDTIDREKLSAVLENGINRISINPQTMSDTVLKTIGRSHTARQVYEAFDLARSLGFHNINMDLIAGLPGDTKEGFKDSLCQLITMNPESITVHTLSYKRSSDLDFSTGLFEKGQDTAEMVDTAAEILYNSGYIPYYMYRQTKSLGNLENVGWCKPGYEGLYNVYMMEECHSILACGAGAVTKLKSPESTDLKRIFNFKYPYEYIDRYNDLLERKEAITNFYARRENGRKETLY